MKKVFVLCLMAVLSLGVYAQSRQGQSSIGISGGYGFNTENALIGLDYRYSITDAIRINPGIGYYIKNDGLTTWVADLNLHYYIPVASSFGIYPLAGANVLFLKRDAVPGRDSSTNTRLGVNLGLGAEVNLSRNVTLGVEGKYNIIKDETDQPIVALRLGYTF